MNNAAREVRAACKEEPVNMSRVVEIIEYYNKHEQRHTLHHVWDAFMHALFLEGLQLRDLDLELEHVLNWETLRYLWNVSCIERVTWSYHTPELEWIEERKTRYGVMMSGNVAKIKLEANKVDRERKKPLSNPLIYERLWNIWKFPQAFTYPKYTTHFLRCDWFTDRWLDFELIEVLCQTRLLRIRKAGFVFDFPPELLKSILRCFIDSY
jgi:hypothetical protein